MTVSKELFIGNIILIYGKNLNSNLIFANQLRYTMMLTNNSCCVLHERVIEDLGDDLYQELREMTEQYNTVILVTTKDISKSLTKYNLKPETIIHLRK